jgi:hypothetical protein
VRLAPPKTLAHANESEIPLSFLKEEPFIGLNRMYPLRRLALVGLPACGFQTAHRGGWDRQRAGIRRGGQRAAAENTCQRCGFPGSDSRGPGVGARRALGRKSSKVMVRNGRNFVAVRRLSDRRRAALTTRSLEVLIERWFRTFRARSRG